MILESLLFMSMLDVATCGAKEVKFQMMMQLKFSTESEAVVNPVI